ncbi:MAG: lysylphosphatidylglycerol synthase transmembrane domain-containing protein [Saprospiraceae bacterium]
MKKAFFKNILKIIIFFGTGIAILGYVYYKQNIAYHEDCIQKGIAGADCNLIGKVYSDFLNSNIFILFLVILVFMLSNVSRAMRWQMMMKSIGMKTHFFTAFHSVVLGYFVNLGIPRAGEFARAIAISKKENLNFSKVMGTIILDRLLDVISLGIVFVITIIVSSGKLIQFLKENNNISSKINNLISNPFVWIIIAVFFAVIVYIFTSKKFRTTRIGAKIYNFITELLEGLKSIKSIKNPGIFIFHSIFIWVMYFMMNYVGFMAFAPTAKLGFDAALTVFTFGSMGIVIPSPGGMGTYHFLVIEALKLYGVNGSDGFSFANIIFFTVQIFGNILFGIIALISLNMKPKDLENELQKQNI